ncbi:23S rRNA (pseudouridine(1915)-N(3))-methyltransferase RlmH [bacterium DOLZORAL124_38_8]|nr:MAG: 23S rRNA (pseudouridine(1915)-N(3))-methyltransferase RlmH [bacterium DOLZORAL124_38_8]
MKVKLYFFGKTGEISAEEKELIKRINFRTNFELVALPQAGLSDVAKTKEKEADLFLSKISEKSFVVAFDERGKDLDSVEFSVWVKKQQETFGDLVFVLGGAHGLHPKVLNRANAKLRFGKMVWTRNLVRHMACEQLYRAFEIQAGSNFHKE